MSDSHRRKARSIQILAIVALVSAPVLLLLSGRAIYLEFARAAEMERTVHHSYVTRSQIQDVFSLLQDAETGQRGYIITGEPRFLEPHNRAVRDLDAQLQKLSTLVAQRPEQLSDFAKLERLVGGQLATLKNGIATREIHGAEAGIAFVSIGIGKAMMTEVRHTVDRMIGREAASLEKNMQAERLRTTRTQLIVAALFVGLVSLAAITALVFWRYSTTRERLLTEVRSTAARQQAIFDSAIDGIITINPSGSIETVNSAAKHMFGYSDDELCRRDISLLLSIGGEQNIPLLKRIGASEGAMSSGVVREFRARRRDGSMVPVDVALGPMELPTGTHIVATIRDISDRRRVEQMKEDFISTVSHELRTPLTSIAGSLALLAGGVGGQLSDKATRLVTIANTNSQRLVRLINNVLDIGKIEAGEFTMAFEPVDLREIAKRSIESMQAYADGYGVKLVLAKGVFTPVRGDADRLIQVATNLLANACKFSPKGASVKVSVRRTGNVARFSVKDEGPGVPEEFRSRIFSKFSQAEGDSQAKGGSGLGLVIAREIVDLHGGRLWFESSTGGGATFHLDLPLRIDAPVRKASKRLLLCDNNKDRAIAVSAMLARGGFSTDRASNADEALQLLNKGGYAAALIGLNLPDIDSVSLIRALRDRAETRDLPLVLLSAVGGAESLEGRPLVIVDWLNEPLDQAHLKVALGPCLKGIVSDRPAILHVDDDPDILELVASTLADVASVTSAKSLHVARAALTRQRPDIVILDLGLADGSGPDLLPELTDKMGRATPVIIYSAPEARAELVDRVDAVLIKSRTSLDLLLKTVERLIAKVEARDAAA